jgi:hypothetical protein
MTKEGQLPDKCPHCGKSFSGGSYGEHPGYGAGAGYVNYIIDLCPICKKGHVEDYHEDVPGFRSHDRSPCCNCGKEKGVDY